MKQIQQMSFLIYYKAIILLQGMYLFNFYNKNGKFINFCIIKYQLLAITLDNASNNDTFVRKLSAKLQEETNIKWNSEDNHF